jgi:hypothetical protein
MPLSWQIDMNKKLSLLLIIILLIAAVWAGAYFRDNIFRLYDKLVKGAQNFEKIDLGDFVKEVQKEIFNPPPLKILNPYKDVILIGSKIISETNLQRAENGGLPALARNDLLDKAALAKANDMFKNQYFEHNSPLGITPADLVKSFGYNYIVTGENLILGNFASEKDLAAAWMASPGHRENILNKRYSEIGVAIIKGIYKGETTWIGVQEFGLPLSACQQPNESLKTQIDRQKTQLENLSNQIDLKKGEIEATHDRKTYNSLVEIYNNLVEQYQKLADAAKNLIAEYNNQVSVFNNCVVGQ